MNRFTRLSGRLIWAITLLQASAATGETRVGWEADFRGSALGGAVEPHYVIRGSGGKTDDSRLILRNSDGTVTIGGKFDQDAAKRGDYVPLEWRDLNLSLLDYPILELRFRPSDRKVNLLVQCVYEFADGSRATPYFYAQFTEPGQWTTVAKRICPDGSLPKPWTPRSLVGFHIWAKSDREVTVDFDWVRLRGLNESERARQNEWVDLLKDYHPEEPPVLSEFFPFGVYDSSPDSSSLHKQTHRMSYRTLSKHHVNFVLAISGAVDAAGEMGIRVGLRMRQCSNRFEEGGTEGVIDWAKPTIERIKDDPTVLCYDVGDERPIAHLWSVAAGVRILQKLDPTRPSILTFWDPAAIRAYGPYVPVDVSDIYPLVPGGGRKPPHYHHEWCRRVARENGNKRQWMILQSFGNPPWRSRSGYLIPTVEQLRLQIWSSLAGGARGIICYSTSYDRYRMLTDQWGNPNELMEEVARIGERIIPLGRRLLDCTVDFESSIGCDNEDLLVGIVRSTARGVSYAIVVNKDLHAPQSGRLRGVRESLYDWIHCERREISPSTRSGRVAVGSTSWVETSNSKPRRRLSSRTESKRPRGPQRPTVYSSRGGAMRSIEIRSMRQPESWDPSSQPCIWTTPTQRSSSGCCPIASGIGRSMPAG